MAMNQPIDHPSVNPQTGQVRLSVVDGQKASGTSVDLEMFNAKIGHSRDAVVLPIDGNPLFRPIKHRQDSAKASVIGATKGAFDNVVALPGAAIEYSADLELTPHQRRAVEWIEALQRGVVHGDSIDDFRVLTQDEAVQLDLMKQMESARHTEIDGLDR